MKAQIGISRLTDVLSVVGRALPSKTTTPILKGVYMQKEKDRLSLCCNNLEMEIVTFVSCETGGADFATVAPPEFIEIVKRLPGPMMEISIKDDRMDITSKKAKFRLHCAPAGEFPERSKKYNSYPSFALPGNVLKEMVAKTVYCANKDSHLTAFQGVLITLDGDKLACAGCDSYRVAIYKKMFDATIMSSEKLEIIIPEKTFRNVARAVKDDDVVRVYIGSVEVAFVVNEFTFLLRLIDAEYPDIENAFPKEPVTTAKVYREQFIGMVTRAALLAEGETRRISLRVAKDELCITAQDEIGNMKDVIPADVGGEMLDKVMLNSKFLLDGLKAFDGELVDIEFNGPRGAVMIKEKDYKYLVLPIAPKE